MSRSAGLAGVLTSDRGVRGILAVAMALSAATLLFLSRDLYFWSDELDWLTYGSNYEPATLLGPHNGHLIGIPRVIYETVPRIFGAAYLPFRALSAITIVICAGLFFVLAKRRVGSAWALPPTLLLLFFGSSPEVVVSPLGLPFSLAIAFGLGGLILLEDGGRGRDAAACILFVLSVASHTFGLLIVFGAGVALLLRRSERRRIWIAAVPIALYVPWWIWALRFDQGSFAASNLPEVPLSMVESAAATVGGLFGLTGSLGTDSEVVETILAVGFGAVAVAGAILLLAWSRHQGITAALVGFTATLLGFWFAVALTVNELRLPSTTRYIWFAAILLLLLLAEAFRGQRPAGRLVTVLVAVFAVALVGNVARLAYSVGGLTERAERVEAQLASIRIAGEAANPDFRPQSVAPRGSKDIVATAGPLNEFMRAHGRLGLSDEELGAQPEDVRADADFTLASALGVAAVPVPADELGEVRRCESAASAEGDVELPFGLLRMSGDGEGELLLGRFADSATVPVGPIANGTPSVLVLPDDEAPGEPWFAAGAPGLSACAFAAP